MVNYGTAGQWIGFFIAFGLLALLAAILLEDR